MGKYHKKTTKNCGRGNMKTLSFFHVQTLAKMTTRVQPKKRDGKESVVVAKPVKSEASTKACEQSGDRENLIMV